MTTWDWKTSDRAPTAPNGTSGEWDVTFQGRLYGDERCALA